MGLLDAAAKKLSSAWTAVNNLGTGTKEDPATLGRGQFQHRVVRQISWSCFLQCVNSTAAAYTNVRDISNRHVQCSGDQKIYSWPDPNGIGFPCSVTGRGGNDHPIYPEFCSSNSGVVGGKLLNTSAFAALFCNISSRAQSATEGCQSPLCNFTISFPSSTKVSITATFTSTAGQTTTQTVIVPNSTFIQALNSSLYEVPPSPTFTMATSEVPPLLPTNEPPLLPGTQAPTGLAPWLPYVIGAGAAVVVPTVVLSVGLVYCLKKCFEYRNRDAAPEFPVQKPEPEHEIVAHIYDEIPEMQPVKSDTKPNDSEYIDMATYMKNYCEGPPPQAYDIIVKKDQGPDLPPLSVKRQAIISRNVVYVSSGPEGNDYFNVTKL